MSTTPKRYRKKPVEIEAAQWQPGDLVSAGQVVAWLDQHGADFYVLDQAPGGSALAIRTLEGTMTAASGDWVIRGVQGEFYPCKPDIFAETYDQVGAGS